MYVVISNCVHVISNGDFAIHCMCMLNDILDISSGGSLTNKRFSLV